MEPVKPIEPSAERLEKFSIQWYFKQLDTLVQAAEVAQRTGESDRQYIIKALETLARDFISPEQIQRHYTAGTVNEYRSRKDALQPNQPDQAEEFRVVVAVGQWLRTCQEILTAGGRDAEDLSRLITPVLAQHLSKLGVQPIELVQVAKPVVAVPSREPVVAEPSPVRLPVLPPAPHDKPVPPPPVIPKPPLVARAIPRAGKGEAIAPATGEVVEQVDSREATRILAATEIHGDEFDGRALTTAVLRAEGLAPKYRANIDGQMVWFSSAAYEVYNRLAVVAYVEQTPGQYTARTYYRSNSHGIWKYLPRYSGYEAHVHHFNKGFGQESISLPWRTQKALATISNQRVSVRDAELIFVGTARNTTGSRSNDTYHMHVNRQGNDLAGVDHTRPWGDKNHPERIMINQIAQRPNFDQPLDQWSYQTDVYGKVQAEVYASNDETLHFVFCRDQHNRVWIASIENITAAPGPTGLRGEWIDAKDLTTPAFDYIREAGSYGNSDLRSGKSYVDMYQNYLSKIPVIQEYIRVRGIPPAVLSPESQPNPVVVAAAAELTPVAVEPDEDNTETQRTAQRASRSKLRRNLTLAGAAGVVGAALYAGHEAYQRHTTEESVEFQSVGLEDIPAEIQEHIIGITPEGNVEFKPQPDWLQVDEGVYRWGEATILAQPDGSALYIPKDTKFDKAFVLPPNPRGNIDWHATKFPVQAVRKLELALEPNGLWRDPQGYEYAVLDGGHLLMLNSAGVPDQFVPYGTSNSLPMVELDDYYQPPMDMLTIDTKIPKGFVDAEAESSLQKIQFNINFKNYDNINAGVPIYPPDYKCMIPERMVPDLAAVVTDLERLGYRLGITEALRPIEVQAYLHKTMKRGAAAAPTENAPHRKGALDIVILDLAYLPVFDTGFVKMERSADSTQGAGVAIESAVKVPWTDEQNAQWKKIEQVFLTHGFKVSKTEAWHLDYQK